MFLAFSVRGLLMVKAGVEIHLGVQRTAAVFNSPYLSAARRPPLREWEGCKNICVIVINDKRGVAAGRAPLPLRSGELSLKRAPRECRCP